MNQQIRDVQREQAPQEQAAGESGSGSAAPSALRAQSEGWARVAREAFQRLERGADAERELERRRNDSGQ